MCHTELQYDVFQSYLYKMLFETGTCNLELEMNQSYFHFFITRNFDSVPE